MVKAAIPVGVLFIHSIVSAFVDASTYGFSPQASGVNNARALQAAIKNGGTILVGEPGVYAISETIYIGSDTTLIFSEGVVLKKVNEVGNFYYLFLNEGALTKTYDHNITIQGLNFLVNGMDERIGDIYGLRGQLGFFYVKNLRIRGLRCFDMERWQFCIQVCTFEDLIIEDVHIKGKKDGIHLGRGKRFTIRDAVFETTDDAIALNGHDYASGNPELGWIENGVIENCYDLRTDGELIGFFCRILAGAWRDWEKGLEVQNSDTVVSNGRLYRVQADPDNTIYTSLTQPTHESGTMELDGINWGVVQEDVTYTAGVRNVVFRNIFLEKPRTSFSIHFDQDRFSRSYYPGSELPFQEQILFENVRVLHEEPASFLNIATPMDVVTLSNSVLQNSWISVHDVTGIEDYPDTIINISNTAFKQSEDFEFIRNSTQNREVQLNKHMVTYLE